MSEDARDASALRDGQLVDVRDREGLLPTESQNNEGASLLTPWLARSRLIPLTAGAVTAILAVVALIIFQSKGQPHDDGHGDESGHPRHGFIDLTTDKTDQEIRHSGGLCLTVRIFRDGAKASLWPCSSEVIAEQQSWHYNEITGQLRNKAGLCMDSGGDHLHVWTCDAENRAQRWKHLNGEIVSQGSKCLATAGHHAKLKPCHKVPAVHKWRMSYTSGFSSVGFGHVAQAGNCLRAFEPGDPGEWLAVAPCVRNSSKQRWRYVHETKQIVVGRDWCLQVEGPNHVGSSAEIAICEYKALRQRWRYFGSGLLANLASGLCLDTAHPSQDGGEVHVWKCNEENDHQHWNLDIDHATSGSPSTAPIHEFYMYRAAGDDWLSRFPVGNMNAANIDGVIWYLINEVVTKYTNGTACPRRFGISSLHRLKVRTKATTALYAEDMNFGVRFAFDQGMCMGRCFENNKCTCHQDCDEHYKKYGYVPGCNRFSDKYPFPARKTPAPDGAWYSLPLKGRCDYPTGETSCTWSWEHAGEVSLLAIEALERGKDNCCHGHCTDFWTQQFSENRTKWRVEKVLDLFEKKFPKFPRTLHAPQCDFKRQTWYGIDPWKRQNPWETKDCYIREEESYTE